MKDLKMNNIAYVSNTCRCECQNVAVKQTNDPYEEAK